MYEVEPTSVIDSTFLFKGAPFYNYKQDDVFETEKNGKLLTVSMWGKDKSMFVNGTEVQVNDIFYEIPKQFLPKEAAREFEAYIKD
ncbi:hypothetical protein ACFQZE_13735 [Paenibacillus sp. GCM10027627]|uniref:hypothetical protein n=1 Tax=unclassified Paenibacillus TaxID=185978 RepID=UPI00363375D4